MSKIAYILGAGCSAGQPPESPGYPLAREFVTALEDFGNRLDGKLDCNRLKSCIDGSVTLLRREATQTLDALAARLGAEAHDLGNGLTTADRKHRHRQIDDAKIATAALFMDLEQKAKATGLPRYQDFLDEFFGNATYWSQASKNSKCCVLTFNYDRLFEMAFISRFKPDTSTSCLYGKSLLNSGMDFVNDECNIKVAPDRFAFLKLHGSIGIRARNEEGYNRPFLYTYYDGLPAGTEHVLNDDRFVAGNPESLIVFPHEKSFVAPGTKTLLSFRDYIAPVWEQAHQLVAEASEIWAIGYRFAPMDRDDVLGLLKSAQNGNCKRLVVRNRKESVDEICERLKRKWLEPAGIDLKVEPYPHPF